MPRDIGPYLKTFTVVTSEKGDGAGIQWAEAKEAAGCTGQPPSRPRSPPPPQQRINWSTMSVVLNEAEKLWSRGVDFHQQQGLHVLCRCCGVPLSRKSGCHKKSQYSCVPYTNGRRLIHPLPPCPPQLNTDRGPPQESKTPELLLRSGWEVRMSSPN